MFLRCFKFKVVFGIGYVKIFFLCWNKCFYCVYYIFIEYNFWWEKFGNFFGKVKYVYLVKLELLWIVFIFINIGVWIKSKFE